MGESGGQDAYKVCPRDKLGISQKHPGHSDMVPWLIHTSWTECLGHVHGIVATQTVPPIQEVSKKVTRASEEVTQMKKSDQRRFADIFLV